MQTRPRHLLLRSVLSTATLVASGVLIPSTASVAQTASETRSDERTEQAVDAGVVTVTSQRVERDALDVPSNLSVIDEQQIRDLRAETVSDVVRILPNVNLQDIPGDYNYFQIRGLPRNIEQSNLPVYVDGVPYTSLYGLNISLMDVEQLELIRGPQGNLFGANARDGVLSVTTRMPSDEAEGRVQLSTGNHRYNKVMFAGSTPLVTGEWYGSLSVQHRQHDGSVHNSHLDKPVDPLDEQTARAALYWEPDDRFNARFSLDATDKDGGTYNYVPGTPALDKGDDLTTAFDEDQMLSQKIRGGSLSMDWQFQPDWTLSSVTGLRKVDTFARFDTDLGMLPYGYYDTWLNEKDTFQELRLSSTPHQGAVDWLFGVSYFNNQDKNRNQYPLGMSQVDGQVERDTYTAYSNGVWRFAPAWTLEAGLRYTHETLTLDSRFDNPALPLPTAVTQGRVDEDYREWLPKAALSYALSDQQRLYMSYGKGMLSGGATWMQEHTSAMGERSGHGILYAPELSTNVELGYKAYLPDSRSTLSLTLYQMDVEDYQHAYPDASFQTRISSVDRVRSQGVEASFSTWLMDNLQAAFSFGYNDAQVDQIDGMTGATALTSIKEGDRVPNAPEHNASIQLNHSMPVSDQWRMRSNLIASYYGETTFDFGGELKQGSYGVLDLNTSFDYSDSLSVRLWAKNVTDERYQVFRMNLGTSDIASYGQPRTVGIDLISRF